MHFSIFFLCGYYVKLFVVWFPIDENRNSSLLGEGVKLAADHLYNNINKRADNKKFSYIKQIMHTRSLNSTETICGMTGLPDKRAAYLSKVP
jgi:hypothetical protein